MRGTLVICPELDSLNQEAARRFLAAVEASSAQEPFRLALAGGSTPRRFYELLASPEWSEKIPWARLHVFWGDERLVPRNHRESNYRMAHEALLARVPLPMPNIHPVMMEAAPQTTADVYEQELRAHFKQARGVPAFDLILLGLGEDAHVASLFPDAPTLDERQRLVAAHKPGGRNLPRVTFTLPLINAARRVFFLVAGANKALALRHALRTGGRLPAQRVAPKKGELVWFVDSGAASGLESFQVEPPASKEAAS